VLLYLWKTLYEWLEYGVVALDAIKKRFNGATAQSEGYVVEWGSNNKVQNKSIRFTLHLPMRNMDVLVREIG
jgi:hypothetical protein